MGAEIYILVAFVVCLIVAACIFIFNITCPTFGYCCSCSTGSCSMQLFGLTEGCASASVDTPPSSNSNNGVCLPPANPGIPGTSASTFAGKKGVAQGMTGDTFGLSESAGRVVIGLLPDVFSARARTTWSTGAGVLP